MDYATTSTVSTTYSDTYMMMDLIVFVIMILFIFVTVAATWRIYEKADMPGWASIVPGYNMYCLFEIALGKGILFLLYFIPFVNVVVSIFLYYKLAQSFGKGIGFTLGLIFLYPIFLCILAYGDAEYEGPESYFL